MNADPEGNTGEIGGSGDQNLHSSFTVSELQLLVCLLKHKFDSHACPPKSFQRRVFISDQHII